MLELNCRNLDGSGVRAVFTSHDQVNRRYRACVAWTTLRWGGSALTVGPMAVSLVVTAAALFFWQGVTWPSMRHDMQLIEPLTTGCPASISAHSTHSLMSLRTTAFGADSMLVPILSERAIRAKTNTRSVVCFQHKAQRSTCGSFFFVVQSAGPSKMHASELGRCCSPTPHRRTPCG